MYISIHLSIDLSIYISIYLNISYSVLRPFAKIVQSSATTVSSCCTDLEQLMYNDFALCLSMYSVTAPLAHEYAHRSDEHRFLRITNILGGIQVRVVAPLYFRRSARSIVLDLSLYIYIIYIFIYMYI